MCKDTENVIVSNPNLGIKRVELGHLLSILNNFNNRKINQVKKLDCREGGEYLRRQETWFIITPSTT